MLPDAALSGIMPAHMLRQSHRLIVLGLLACSVALLIPGLFAPVLTIRGVLTREGIAQVAPTMLERGLSDETVEVLKSMMNPSMVVLLEMTGGDLRKMILEKLGPQITGSAAEEHGGSGGLRADAQHPGIGAAPLRSRQPGPGDADPALQRDRAVREGGAGSAGRSSFRMPSYAQRTLRFVETIAKWSMADVFVVALFIAYLAAQASAAPTQGPNAAPALLVFDARFGAGFYWFAAYCLFSLASQQFTVRLAARTPVAG